MNADHPALVIDIEARIDKFEKAIDKVVGEFLGEQKPEAWWKTATPWFERHGKPASHEAADLEAGFYGTKEAVWINRDDAARYTRLVASGDLTVSEVRTLLHLPPKEASE